MTSRRVHPDSNSIYTLVGACLCQKHACSQKAWLTTCGNENLNITFTWQAFCRSNHKPEFLCRHHKKHITQDRMTPLSPLVLAYVIYHGDIHISYIESFLSHERKTKTESHHTYLCASKIVHSQSLKYSKIQKFFNLVK